MLVLLTFGGAALVNEADGKPLPASSQRRTLALMSTLAVASPRGLSRDKLVGLLWPDADADRASHALTQALYAARRGLDCDDLFVLGNDVRLNTDRVESDVEAFEEAVGAGEFEEAISLYKGAFLDGFFFTGSPNFERWQANERRRLESLAAQSMERLCDREEEKQDYRRAVDWLLRLAALKPLDASVAIRLMNALALAGDRAAAIRHARVHSELLREELDLPPDDAVATLARRIRDGQFGHSPALQSVLGDASRRQTALALDAESGTESSNLAQDGNGPDARRAEPALAETHVAQRDDMIDTASRESPTRRRVPRATWLLAASGVAILLAGATVTRALRGGESNQPVVRQSVVIMPFRVSGASSSLGYLRDGMVELLSTRLSADSIAPAIDAGAILGAWRASGLANLSDIPRDSMIALAARLGAERVIVGSVVGTRGRFVIQASAFRTHDATVTATATVEGAADSLTQAIDRLAAKLLLSEAGEDQRLAGHRTTSIGALRAFLAGQSAARRGKYSDALRWYRVAIARDSMFALAALRLAVVADEADEPSTVREAVAFAWGKQLSLNARERALLAALAGGRFPDVATLGEQRRALQDLVDINSPSSDHWFALGSRLFHEGKLLAVADADRRAQSAIARTLVLNPNHFGATRIAAHLDVTMGGASATHDTGMPPPTDTTNPFGAFMEWRATRGSPMPLENDGGRHLQQFSRASLRDIALASQYDAVGLTTGFEALQTLARRAASRADTIEVLLGEHSLAMNQGRVDDALRLTARLEAALPGTHSHWRLRMLDALYGNGDTAAAANAANRLERLLDATTVQTSSRRTRLADQCVLAQWKLAQNDTSTVPRIVRELRSSIDVAPAAVVGSAAAACGELLDAALAVVTDGRRARSRLASLDSLVFSPVAAADATTFAPLLIARLHEKIGDYDRAARALERRAYMSMWPRYSAEMLKEQAHLAEIIGDSALMRAAERGYLAWRSRPVFDDDIRPRRGQ